MKIKNLSNLLLITALTSCTMAPKYQKPQAPVPFAVVQDSQKRKIAMVSWREYFQSSDLQRIIQLALDHNRDLKIAALNIEEAQGLHGVARSILLPSISGVVSETRQGVPSAFAGFMPKKQFRANLTLTSYEVDFFGRLQSLKKSALEDYLATQEAHNVVKIGVIAETANAYAQLLLDSQLLKIAQENAQAQSDRLRFSELRYQNGIDSLATTLTIRTLAETAITNLETYKKIVAQDKNALMALTGIFDESSLPQVATLDDIEIDEDLLDAVPSESLLLRPDIQQAEHSLLSANANIGAARAAFFPSITLTGTYGYASRSLEGLFDSKSWTFTPQVNLPIFSGGRNMANLDISHARKKIQIVQYEKAIQTAFREASDQLVEREAVMSQLKTYEKIVAGHQKSYDLVGYRHDAGIMSGYEMVETKIALLTAKNNWMTTKKQYIANLISLYKVMGGGAELEEIKAEEKKK